MPLDRREKTKKTIESGLPTSLTFHAERSGQAEGGGWLVCASLESLKSRRTFGDRDDPNSCII